MERLWHHFENANQAAAAHSQAAWEYPLNLASRLHEKLNEEPGQRMVDIVIHKFQHLRKAEDSDEFVAVDTPDVISFTPILDSSTYQHGIGTNHYSFKVEYHSRSPLLQLFLPLTFPTPIADCILNLIYVPRFINHVTFLSTVTLLFIITCQRGSSSPLSRTLTHCAYLLTSDTLYDTLTRCGRPFPSLSCI